LHAPRRQAEFLRLLTHLFLLPDPLRATSFSLLANRTKTVVPSLS
jgi:hypothetical protein